MKMDKKTIIAIVLGIVAVGIVLFQFKGVFSPGVKRVASVAPEPKAASSAMQTSSAKAGQESLSVNDYTRLVAQMTESDITFKNRGFRNPMTPLIDESQRDARPSGPATKVVAPKTEALAMGYTLEGIVWGEIDSFALVNNQVVGVGEKLDDGALVTQITRDTVRFIRDGNRYYLVLREE
jgi:hypothetical protein